jgi:hypothetical protein
MQEEEEDEDDGEGSEGEEGGGGGARRGSGPAGARKPIYNVDGLHEKLEDIAWAEEHGWEETQVVAAEEPTVVDNIDDDLGRELAFYNQVGSPWLTTKGRPDQPEAGAARAASGGGFQRAAVKVGRRHVCVRGHDCGRQLAAQQG